MKILDLKNLNLISDLVLKIYGLISAPIVHNLSKSRALKIIFWHLAVDQVAGCYVEFGVATGNSMRSAEIAERRSLSPSLGVKHVERKLYGFDTFSRFSSESEFDSHPTWEGESFSTDIAKVKNRFKKYSDRIFFHKVDASRLGQEESFNIEETITDKSIAIALFDMDLGAPTLAGLKWIAPKLVSGSIIIFDEFLAYKGDPNLGEAGAWKTFLQQNPHITSRQFLTYGDGGVAFQITVTKNDS